MSRIKAVFFDADDTVFTVYPSVAHHYNRILAQYGAEMPEEELAGIIRRCWQIHLVAYENRSEGYAASVEQDKQLWIQYAAQVLDEILSQPHPQEIAHQIYEHFSKGETRKIRDGLIETSQFLKKEGIYLGLFTNNDMRTHAVVNELGLRTLFDVVLTAGEVGFKKPAPAAFTALLTHSKTSPHETLFVGDSFEHDCIGAIEAGWNAVWLNPRSLPPPSSNGPPVTAIASIAELKRHIL